MRSLDLSATGLQSSDLNYFFAAINDPQANIKLESLNLSNNLTVNDSVLKNVCNLFRSNPNVKQLILDNTKITIHGLIEVLNAVKETKNVRTISVKNCNLNLVGEDGETIIKLLHDNISITNLIFDDNNFDVEFVAKLNEQLELNRKIVKHVLSQLSEQEA